MVMVKVKVNLMCLCKYDLSFFLGHKLDLRSLNQRWLLQLGTKAVSPIGNMLIFGSVIKVRARVKFR